MDAFRIRVSPKQMSRLRNGHRVKVQPAIDGEGVNLIVHPEKINHLTRCFSKGAGAMVQLSPEELQANREIGGEGIFDTLKKAAKNPLVKSLGKMAIDQAVSMAPIPPALKGVIAGEAKKAAFGKGVFDTLKKAAKNPLVKSLGKQALSAGAKYAASSGYVPPALVAAAEAEAQRRLAGAGFMDTLKKAAKSPLAKSLGKQAISAGAKYAAKSGYIPPEIVEAVAGEAKRQLEGAGILDTLKKAAKNPLVKSLGKQAISAGAKYAKQSGYIPPEIVSAIEGEARRQLEGAGIMDTLKAAAKNKMVKSLGKQAIAAATKYAASSGYVPPEIASALGSAAQGALAGAGLYASGRGMEGEGLYASARGRGVMGKGALMNVHNNSLPPAMQSQNASANFHFGTQLPPHLAELKGRGLYA